MKKYWMSLIVALSTLACVCGAETAAAPKVSVKAVGPDKAVVSGQSFDVKLNFTTSSPVEIMTTTFFAYILINELKQRRVCFHIRRYEHRRGTVLIPLCFDLAHISPL